MSNYDFSLPCPGEPKKVEKKKKYENENCIEGFHVAIKPLKPRERFPLPVIPIDFVPLQSKKSRWDSAVRTVPKPKVISVQERTRIIDDDAMNVSNIPLPEEKPSEESPPASQPTTNVTFRPFAADPDKQERYEKFLTFKNLGLKGKYC